MCADAAASTSWAICRVFCSSKSRVIVVEIFFLRTSLIPIFPLRNLEALESDSSDKCMHVHIKSEDWFMVRMYFNDAFVTSDCERITC